MTSASQKKVLLTDVVPEEEGSTVPPRFLVPVTEIETGGGQIFEPLETQPRKEVIFKGEPIAFLRIKGSYSQSKEGQTLTMRMEVRVGTTKV